MPDTIKNNDLLNKVFDELSILRADIPTLQRYLVACAEMRPSDITNPRVLEGIPLRAELIRHIIASRQQDRAFVGVKWTIGISAVNFMLLVIKIYLDLE